MSKFIKNVGYALSGIGFAIRTQRHMQIHVISAIIVIALGLIAALDATRWCLLILAIGMVISAELMNTALEQAVDLASPGLHPLAKTAKDVAAGAVLATAVAAIAIGLLVLGPPLWKLVA
ncbi:diacylglycerol kinase family protein [Paenibacillus sp. strain BS8-2]